MLRQVHLYVKPARVLGFFLIVFLGTANLACLYDDGLTTDAHLEKAFESGELQHLNEAEAHALKAAALGSVCAEGFLAGLYQPNSMVIRANDGSIRRTDGNWIGIDQDKALDWSKRFEASLLKLAEEGNPTAMFYIGIGYTGMRGFAMNHLPVNDSLSLEWLEKAALAGHDRAILAILMNNHIKQDPVKKKTLLKKFAEQGNGEAYRWLSLMYLGERESTPNPEEYFSAIRQAVDSGISGVYAWVKKDLEKLEEQAAKGNEASIGYLQIADSLEIRTRLESLPDAGAQIKDPRDLAPKEAFCQGLP